MYFNFKGTVLTFYQLIGSTQVSQDDTTYGIVNKLHFGKET